jgi:hypothetical protein
MSEIYTDRAIVSWHFSLHTPLKKSSSLQIEIAVFRKQEQAENKQNTANNESPAAQRNWYLYVV